MGYKGEELYQSVANFAILSAMAPKKLYPVTPRQREILQALADGAHTYADVGKRLGIKESTVKQYMSSERKYLPGVLNVIEKTTGRRVHKWGALKWAIAEGLVTLSREKE